MTSGRFPVLTRGLIVSLDPINPVTGWAEIDCDGVIRRARPRSLYPVMAEREGQC
jgi:hypothetical protein